MGNGSVNNVNEGAHRTGRGNGVRLKSLFPVENVVDLRNSVLCSESWCSSDTASWGSGHHHERSDLCASGAGPCGSIRDRQPLCLAVLQDWQVGGLRHIGQRLPARSGGVSQGQQEALCCLSDGLPQLIPLNRVTRSVTNMCSFRTNKHPRFSTCFNTVSVWTQELTEKRQR